MQNVYSWQKWSLLSSAVFFYLSAATPLNEDSIPVPQPVTDTVVLSDESSLPDLLVLQDLPALNTQSPPSPLPGTSYDFGSSLQGCVFPKILNKFVLDSV